MNRKGETSGLWYIVMAAVAILIGVAFYSTSIQQNIGQMTKTFETRNVSVTLAAAGSSVEVDGCGQKALTATLINSSSGTILTDSNYTLTQSAGTDGYLAAKVTTDTGAVYASKPVNMSCTYEPKGYVTDGGSRAMVVLIGIFTALLILVAALPNLRNGLMDFIKG